MISSQLSSSDVQELSRALLTEVGMASTPGGLTCARLGWDSPYADLARVLEREIFAADLHEPPDQTEAEYADYESGSHFFLALDAVRCRPVGVMRIVTQHAGWPKTLNDLAEVLPQAAVAAAWHHRPSEQAQPLSQSKVWDVGSLAVAPQFRGSASAHAVSGMLYRSLWAAALASSADRALMLVCTATLARLRSFGMPMRSLNGLPPVTYPGLGQFHGKLLDLANCPTHMRAFAGSLLASAGPDSRAARQRRDFIEAVLTGAGIDDKLAFTHGPLS